MKSHYIIALHSSSFTCQLFRGGLLGTMSVQELTFLFLDFGGGGGRGGQKELFKKNPRERGLSRTV